jgi:hypothetical protein
MNPFETIRLGARFRAEVVHRGKTSLLEVDEAFEVAVAAVPCAATNLVATVRESGDGGIRTIEFLHMEGRIFRALRADYDPDVWTPDRCRRETPTIGLDYNNRIAGGFETSLLATPWRQVHIQAKDNGRRRAPKPSPHACREAGQLLEAFVARDLRLVDGVLFHETRSPVWSVDAYGDSSRVSATIPDLTRDPGTVLLDPRYSADDIHAALARSRRGEARATVEVHDGALLPATIAADAIASFCLSLYRKIVLLGFGHVEPRIVGEVMLLVDSVERALKHDETLASCYEGVERLATCGPDGIRTSGSLLNSSELVEAAKLFLLMKRTFPPTSIATENDDEMELEAFCLLEPHRAAARYSEGEKSRSTPPGLDVVV